MAQVAERRAHQAGVLDRAAEAPLERVLVELDDAAIGASRDIHQDFVSVVEHRDDAHGPVLRAARAVSARGAEHSNRALVKVDMWPFQCADLALAHHRRDGEPSSGDQPRIGLGRRRESIAAEQPLLLTEHKIVPLAQRRQDFSAENLDRCDLDRRSICGRSLRRHHPRRRQEHPVALDVSTLRPRALLGVGWVVRAVDSPFQAGDPDGAGDQVERRTMLDGA